jgi:hypothetical protein
MLPASTNITIYTNKHWQTHWRQHRQQHQPQRQWQHHWPRHSQHHQHHQGTPPRWRNHVHQMTCHMRNNRSNRQQHSQQPAKANSATADINNIGNGGTPCALAASLTTQRATQARPKAMPPPKKSTSASTSPRDMDCQCKLHATKTLNGSESPPCGFNILSGFGANPRTWPALSTSSSGGLPPTCLGQVSRRMR